MNRSSFYLVAAILLSGCSSESDPDSPFVVRQELRRLPPTKIASYAALRQWPDSGRIQLNPYSGLVVDTNSGRVSYGHAPSSKRSTWPEPIAARPSDGPVIVWNQSSSLSPEYPSTAPVRGPIVPTSQPTYLQTAGPYADR